MTKSKETPAGFLALTLHAHLPYVVNHGTWPHGMAWLLEAAAETYLPLLRMLGNLERDGVPANININLSPILLEQLAHPVFIAEFPKYVTRKIVATREDEAFFIQAGEVHLAETARFWHRFFTTALDDFNALGGKIIDGFRHFSDIGMIEILTSGATHGYMPLLGTDESVRAQVRTAVETHVRHLGHAPRGIWSPECGYRPAGPWNYPVLHSGSDQPLPGFDRIGVEQAIAESSIDYFFVDTHQVEESEPTGSSSMRRNGWQPQTPELEQMTHNPDRRFYQPYFVDGPGDSTGSDSMATVFPRDPRTAVQVWSSDMGYPADPNYLDFHKKRFPGGHRYWQVTGRHVDIADKQPYRPEQAAERIKSHASHFVQLVTEALQPGFNEHAPPILSGPFDAELFGHWWFEGVQWVEAVCRTLHESEHRHRHYYVQPVSRPLSACRLHRYARRLVGDRRQQPGMDESGHELDLHAHLSCGGLYARGLFGRQVEGVGAWPAHRATALPGAAAARILGLAIADHHRRGARLRRDALPDAQRPVS